MIFPLLRLISVKRPLIFAFEIEAKVMEAPFEPMFKILRRQNLERQYILRIKFNKQLENRNDMEYLQRYKLFSFLFLYYRFYKNFHDVIKKKKWTNGSWQPQEKHFHKFFQSFKLLFIFLITYPHSCCHWIIT